jgi:hypothetical protein
MPSTNDVVQIFTAQHGVYDRFVNYVRYPQGLRSFFEQSSLLRSDLSVLDAGCGTGRYEEAEDLYRAAGKRDERPQQLLGFLYRQAVVRNRASAQPAYEEALLAQFPQGPATRGDDVRQAPDRVSISTPRPRSAARWTPCGRHHCGPRGMAGGEGRAVHVYQRVLRQARDEDRRVARDVVERRDGDARSTLRCGPQVVSAPGLDRALTSRCAGAPRFSAPACSIRVSTRAFVQIWRILRNADSCKFAVLNKLPGFESDPLRQSHSFPRSTSRTKAPSSRSSAVSLTWS